MAASIVAISSIHPLKAFPGVPDISNDKLMWHVIIHMTFVLSALGTAFVERIIRAWEQAVSQAGLARTGVTRHKV